MNKVNVPFGIEPTLDAGAKLLEIIGQARAQGLKVALVDYTLDGASDVFVVVHNDAAAHLPAALRAYDPEWFAEEGVTTILPLDDAHVIDLNSQAHA